MKTREDRVEHGELPYACTVSRALTVGVLQGRFLQQEKGKRERENLQNVIDLKDMSNLQMRNVLLYPALRWKSHHETQHGMIILKVRVAVTLEEEDTLTRMEHMEGLSVAGKNAVVALFLTWMK